MFRGFSIIAAIAMLGVVGEVRAQAIAVDDPSGGFTPGTTFCPSTGGCFTSLGAAEAALRAAVPDVGQFLYNSRLQKLSSGEIRSYYAVRPQAPLQYDAPYYMFLEDVEATQYCPASANEFGGCGDEAEMIANYFTQRVNPGVVYSCGWNKCYNLDPRVEGGYVPLNRTDSTSTPPRRRARRFDEVSFAQDHLRHLPRRSQLSRNDRAPPHSSTTLPLPRRYGSNERCAGGLFALPVPVTGWRHHHDNHAPAECRAMPCRQPVVRTIHDQQVERRGGLYVRRSALRPPLQLAARRTLRRIQSGPRLSPIPTGPFSARREPIRANSSLAERG